ncbi:MAG: protoporphyrinogen oxidase [Candidatus Hydrogenedentes bacterium]|nr:protoporphyrinogen oxidase [Candidatus Hydrogenedentota bacterium]
MTEPRKVVVIGGGITGLCAGYYAMKRHGRDAVAVLEAGPTPGGTAYTETVDGFTFEKGPNGFLDKEPKTLQWVRDLDLENRVVKANTLAARRFIYRNGALHEVKPPPAFLASKLLSLQGRLRLLGEPFIPQRVSEEEESIWDFAARRIGAESADTLVSPMVSGIFGGDAKQLHLASCFPRMAAMEAEHGGLVKAMLAKRKQKGSGQGSAMGPGGTLTSFNGGMAVLIDRAAEELGASLRLNTPAARIERADGVYRVQIEGGETLEAESVIVAAPAHVAAGLTHDLDADLGAALSEIPYASMTVVCTGYERKAIGHDLHGFGFLVPRTQQKRILGCIWTSTLFPGRAPKDKAILRTMIGGATDPGAVELDDEAFLAILREELFPMLDIQADPVVYRIYRWEKAIPQYTFGHQARLRRIEAAEARHPGLRFAGNSYRGVGINDCVLSALRALGEEVP